MNQRPTSPFKILLAAWLTLSVLAAGLLARAPELHAAVHQHHSHPCHDHDHEEPSPDRHHCLVQLIADGTCETAAIGPAIVLAFLPTAAIRITEAASPAPRARRILPPGRAPPRV